MTCNVPPVQVLLLAEGTAGLRMITVPAVKQNADALIVISGKVTTKLKTISF